ncbi:polysaccharide deacetylase [Ruegeria sediminis]|uniref:Polysaccharide deacetylase n=1 Tax=Ruegeria sediminis TaxID=2583820 RepID=A0ABY2WXJ3_9RHOB|nr:polysaccharide deacetylase family protein [Ruegeria sediminis]TMV07585.1 polysaccharide deacetylase [Ruegeria sediminis]
MIPDWTPLDRELELWQQEGLILPLWWRDDDAVAPTPELDRLSDLSERIGLPVHLAVIPQPADIELAGYLQPRPHLIPVVHGWAHRNHAPAGEKKAEFRLHRPLEAILADAEAGLARLTALFGPALRPIFVPPWNRIAPEVVARLPELGFRVLSTATPRTARLAVPGLEQVNTHLDPIDWRGTRGLTNPEILVARLASLLQQRREGWADNAEPFGLLTHHLVHDQDIWNFTGALIRRLMAGPVRVWTAPADRT